MRLLPNDGSHDTAAEAKFSLDSSVGDEGSNFSAGEKQLLALCRALVKNSRIIVLVRELSCSFHLACAEFGCRTKRRAMLTLKLIPNFRRQSKPNLHRRHYFVSLTG